MAREYNPSADDYRLTNLRKFPAVFDSRVPPIRQTVRDKTLYGEDLFDHMDQILSDRNTAQVNGGSGNAMTQCIASWEAPRDSPVRSTSHVGGYFYGILDGSVSQSSDVYKEVVPMKSGERPVTTSRPGKTVMIVPYRGR